MKLARFLIIHYPATKALKAISRWELTKSPLVQQLYNELQSSIARDHNNQASTSPSPAVIVTEASKTVAGKSQGEQVVIRSASFAAFPPDCRQDQLPRSPSTSRMIASRTITAPNRSDGPDHAGLETRSGREATPSDANDTAHQLWQHLRRDSLSADKMLIALSGESLHQLEATDEELKALRERALANKRSIGAETLKACKWDDKQTHGATPWL
ncbi:hypothetical protein CERZMDRAFT_90896 [Cercospora zeae-maydis SCOH1-5]|uniref:Uncharacterized protein n=1 Tax=Cercospora zeae-maydis SCOH1-5 TaxID=717836 RepID=A0A6A6FEM8_9PEZI|nr:hypothetical protein CERZMDRAFT_90896 [Cercospora zeae-maydis SCOH1-5]